jgi:hypothetical protein
VEENYGLSVRDAMSNGEGNPTIYDATNFYLSNDITDPYWIPNFRCNLLHIPEA